MKRFQFRLAVVLRIRSHETAAAQSALQVARRLVAEQQQALSEAREQRLAHAAELAQRRSQGMTVRQWALTWEHQQSLGKVEEAAAAELQGRLAVLRERRQQVAEARRKERALEKLQEKHREQYEFEQFAIEQASLDEVSQFRALRSRKGGGAQ